MRALRPEEASCLRFAWPLHRAGTLVAAVARRAGVPCRSPGGDAADAEATGGLDSLAAIGDRLGLELEPVSCSLAECEGMLRSCPPALLALPPRDGAERRLLGIAGSAGSRALVVTPDLRLARIPIRDLAGALRGGAETTLAPSVEAVLDAADLDARRRRRVGASLLGARLRSHRCEGCWLVRASPSMPLSRALGEEGVARDVVRFVALYAFTYGLLLASWAALGAAALQGRLVMPWLVAWALLLATMLPVRLLSVWAQARLTVGLGAFLKRRLLHGALGLDADRIRAQGAGQLLGRVIESEAVETLILNGGFLAVVGAIEVVMGGSVVALGPSGAGHLLVLVGWVLATLLMAWRFLAARQDWTDRRLEMTHDLVERLVGYRTRLAQESRSAWHRSEAGALDAYLPVARRFDRTKAVLLSLVPRGWLLVSLVWLATAFTLETSARTSLALGIAGTLAAWRGFSKLSEGFAHLSGAWISWQRVSDLSAAASERAAEVGSERSVVAATGTTGAVLEGLDLAYSFPRRYRPVLDGCTLRLEPGDRVLLDGPSGGGKSTLAALLVGLRQPTAGLVLLDGLDRRSLGDTLWRRRVVLAPQLHENHVLTGSLAFNLLMGRGWPPDQSDLDDAAAVCRELGLGPLLDRMPAGLQQIVGETGWQLSHGEKSRLFIARALLQRPEVLILDEGLAALDPETLDTATSCVLARAPTLLAIAHP